MATPRKRNRRLKTVGGLRDHAYISTACQHDKHAYCRIACKFCKARCLCPCGHKRKAGGNYEEVSIRVKATEHAYENGLFHTRDRPVLGTMVARGIGYGDRLSVKVRVDGRKNAKGYHCGFWEPIEMWK